MGSTAKAQRTYSGMLIATLVGLVLAVLAAEGVMRFAAPHWREYSNHRFQLRNFVPGYGVLFTGRPGFDGYFAQNDGDFRVRVKINDFGLRNGEPVSAADGRVWVVGDSMTFGWGVEANEIYSAVAAERTGIPTYNIASPGTNVCGYQALLARMPETVHPRAVIVGLVIENDILDYHCPHGDGPRVRPPPEDDAFSIGSFKISMMRHSALYNFLAVTLKRISVVDELLIRIGLVKQPHAYRRHFNTSDIPGRVMATVAELAYLRDRLPVGTPLAVLVIPARFDIRDSDTVFIRLRKALVAELEKAGIAALDPRDAFHKAGFAPTHFVHDGHWSPRGHAVAGSIVAAWLKSAVR